MKGKRYFWKNYRLGILSISGVSLIFLCVFFVYDLPLGAVIYPFVLSFIFITILCGLMAFRKGRKNRKLEEIKKLPSTDIRYSMPAPENEIEETYNEIIEKLSDEFAKTLEEKDIQFRDMKDYYATWAHQIKTPIAAMKINLQSEDSAASRTLLNNLSSVESYVDMVMTYVRLTSDNSDYLIKEENIKTMVNEAIRKQKSVFIDKKLGVKVEVEDEYVLTDKKWASIILEQILSNALKYTNEGLITFSFDKEKNELSITDTGIGIDEANLPRIFEKGFTGFNGRTKSHSSGIGLYISKKIADNLHIDLKCESVVNKGTKMTLIFPKAKDYFE